jgi:hypothetical protein
LTLVGIDAQHTHAIIIRRVYQLWERLGRIKAELASRRACNRAVHLSLM